MQKKSFQFLALIFLFFIIINSIFSEEIIPTLKKYSFQDPDVSIDLPENWVIEKAEDEYGVVDAKDKEELRYVIVSHEYSENRNLDQFYESFLKLISDPFGNNMIMDQGDDKIGKYPAKWVVNYTYMENRNMMALNYIIDVDNHKYIIGGYCLAEKFVENKFLFEKIIKSFKLE